MDSMLNLVKKIIPKKLFKFLQPFYHFILGYFAALYYGWPSEKMIVIGITGTTGKTTAVLLMAEILEKVGIKVGYMTTAMFSDGEKKWLNNKKMTMMGRFFSQNLLKKMADNKCEVAIVETTSEGIVQYRHRFINYDILVFNGLYPEHLESHGGFENYKKAKSKLFQHLKNCKKKNINAKNISKTIIANGNDANAQYFLNFWAENKIVYATDEYPLIVEDYPIILGEKIESTARGLSFSVDGQKINMNLLGRFNVGNSVCAIAACNALGISSEKAKAGLESILGIPGRLEKIDEGQEFTVIVDYAFEPNAITKLYDTVNKIQHKKIIHLLGSAGGGRDKARRPKIGKLASEKADIIIVTNEDPYDEDPIQIIEEVCSGITDKIENKNLWKILDRREAIAKAIGMAQEGDIILVTGKGSEQAMCIAGGRKIKWDDREVVREELQKIK